MGSPLTCSRSHQVVAGEVLFLCVTNADSSLETPGTSGVISTLWAIPGELCHMKYRRLSDLEATTFPGLYVSRGPSLTHPRSVLLQGKLSIAMSLCSSGIRNKVRESPEQRVGATKPAWRTGIQLLVPNSLDPSRAGNTGVSLVLKLPRFAALVPPPRGM